MAYRRIVRWAVDEAGNVIGGTGYEGRVYLANTLTLASIWLDSAGSFAAGNPHSPNTGTQTSSTANMLVGDTSITVISTTGYAVGDLVPIDGSAGRFYGVIRTVTDATHLLFTQTLAQMGGGATMNSGALVGGPEMTGHWQCFAQDTSDYDFTLKNLATGKEGPPEGVATLSTAGTIAFQDEGVSTGVARPTVNFVGAGVSAADDAGNNRVNVTVGIDPGASYVTTAAEASLSNEKVLGTTVIAKGTLGSRPAASTSGYLYFATDGAGGTAGTLGALYRDTGAAWELVATNTAVDVQTFTGNGTWTKPTTFTPKAVLVIGAAAGGGGAGGRGGAAASERDGGGAGGGGAYVTRVFDPSALAATESIGIGAAGTSGAGGSSADGNDGGVGGSTTFGAHLTVYGGGGGRRGTAASGSGGGGGGGSAGAGTTAASSTGGAGGSPPGVNTSAATSVGGGTGGFGATVGTSNAGQAEYGGGGGGGSQAGIAGLNGGSAIFGGGGGGAGGGVSAANAESVGGTGGASISYSLGGGGTAGAVNGGAGGAGTSRSLTGKAGDGGGGGGSQDAGTGGAGGNGGAPGGGGGGGGAGTTTGGAGGAGGRGECLVYTFG